jgi:hypothetical protein
LQQEEKYEENEDFVEICSLMEEILIDLKQKKEKKAFDAKIA